MNQTSYQSLKFFRLKKYVKADEIILKHHLQKYKTIAIFNFFNVYFQEATKNFIS